MFESRLQNRWQGLARLFSFTRPPHANKFGATLHLAQIFLATKSLRWDQLVQGFSADARLAGRLVDQQLGVGLQRCNVPHIGILMPSSNPSLFLVGTISMLAMAASATEATCQNGTVMPVLWRR